MNTANISGSRSSPALYHPPPKSDGKKTSALDLPAEAVNVDNVAASSQVPADYQKDKRVADTELLLRERGSRNLITNEKKVSTSASAQSTDNAEVGEKRKADANTDGAGPKKLRSVSNVDSVYAQLGKDFKKPNVPPRDGINAKKSMEILSDLLGRASIGEAKYLTTQDWNALSSAHHTFHPGEKLETREIRGGDPNLARSNPAPNNKFEFLNEKQVTQLQTDLGKLKGESGYKSADAIREKLALKIQQTSQNHRISNDDVKQIALTYWGVKNAPKTKDIDLSKLDDAMAHFVGAATGKPHGDKSTTDLVKSIGKDKDGSTAISHFVSEVADSPYNLRFGDSKYNSKISNKNDPNLGTTADGSITPRSRQGRDKLTLLEQAYRDLAADPANKPWADPASEVADRAGRPHPDIAGSSQAQGIELRATQTGGQVGNVTPTDNR